MPIDIGHSHRPVTFGAPSEEERIENDLGKYESGGLQAFSHLSALEVLSKKHLMERALDDALTPEDIAQVLQIREQTVRYGLAHHGLIDFDGALPRLPPWSKGRVHPKHVYRAPRSEPHAKRPSTWD